MLCIIPSDASNEFFRYVAACLREDSAIELTRELDPAADLLVRGAPSADDLDALPKLRALVVPYAGVPRRTRELLATRPQIALYNLHHNASATAETAIALMLAVMRGIIPADQALRKGDWSPRYSNERSLLLENRRLLVLGFGSIGRRVAQVGQALGMRVTALRRSDGDSVIEGMHVRGIDQIDHELPQADVIQICLPDTDETTGLLSAERISRLKRGAVIVNTGRAAVVNQKALFEALKSGQLGGAGLDVWWNYPKSVEERSSTRPADFPFEALSNVVMSPHRAGHSDMSEDLRAGHCAELLRAIANSDTSLRPVDLAAGY